VTRAPGKPYASSDALRAAIVARANAATRADPRFTVQERLRQFAYARLLARVFTFEPDSWVLKGGVSLLARVPGARHSLDIDLWGRQHSLAEAERALELASAVDLGDYASFDVGAWSERGDEEARPLAVRAWRCLQRSPCQTRRRGRQPIAPTRNDSPICEGSASGRRSRW
jgi:hypothetical protein